MIIGLGIGQCWFRVGYKHYPGSDATEGCWSDAEDLMMWKAKATKTAQKPKTGNLQGKPIKPTDRPTTGHPGTTRPAKPRRKYNLGPFPLWGDKQQICSVSFAYLVNPILGVCYLILLNGSKPWSIFQATKYRKHFGGDPLGCPQTPCQHSFLFHEPDDSSWDPEAH